MKRALVTGAGRRLGRELAVSLGARGYQVGIHFNGSREGAEGTLKAVQDAGGDGVVIAADLTSEIALTELFKTVSDALGGPLDVLVNNASAFEVDTLNDHNAETWRLHMAVNLRAPVRLSQLFAAQLPKGQSGVIVNMIDQRVRKLNPLMFSYTLSKSALWTATQTMAQALAPNVRVNAIGPGPTLQGDRQSTEDFEKQVTATLTGRGSNPQEIRKAFYYLLDADAVTGQMIAVDGGQHLVWQTPDVDGVKE